jgi:hypothetical protein
MDEVGVIGVGALGAAAELLARGEDVRFNCSHSLGWRAYHALPSAGMTQRANIASAARSRRRDKAVLEQRFTIVGLSYLIQTEHILLATETLWAICARSACSGAT